MKFPSWLLALLLASMPLRAESSLRAEIPFPFEMSGKVLPAGTYEISFLSPVISAVRHTADPAHAALTVDFRGMHRDGKPIETPRLIFRKHGDRRFLAQVWTHESYRLVNQSRQERELAARRLSAEATPCETVVVSAGLAR